MFWKLNAIYKKLEKMENKIHHDHKVSNERLDKIEKVLIVQEQNLQTHMKRSDNLEKIVQNIENKELRPIRKHISMVEGGLKLIGLLGVLASIVASVLKVIGII